MAKHPRITLAPDIMAGKPVVRGTRLAVEFIIGLLADGWTEAEILSNYPGWSGRTFWPVLATPVTC